MNIQTTGRTEAARERVAARRRTAARPAEALGTGAGAAHGEHQDAQGPADRGQRAAAGAKATTAGRAEAGAKATTAGRAAAVATRSGAPAGEAVGDEDVVEAVLLASRAMVSLAEASVHQVNESVTLPQYRTLVLLATQEPCRLADLAEAMGVNPSTATRMCDRLVRKGLVERERDQLDRREIELSLSADGRSLVSKVTERRRDLVRGMLGAIPSDERRGMVRALAVLARAIGEAPAQHWAAGWTSA